ncbi:DoxX family protein [Mucilaginibacter sp. CSA2-8R]|uniref:DoxX family protein n=1 Tax=Mucilaginibacter sp. CSA2-8R TaxID=3141542 RepID=UPI00315D3411
MKAIKITYWITTVIVALMMMNSAVMYLTKPEMKQAFVHLGFPNYFRIELAVFKLLGAVVLLTPLTSRLKEWAYAWFAIVFVSAFIAHAASGDPVVNRVMPLVFLVVLLVSYFTYHRLPQFKTGK